MNIKSNKTQVSFRNLYAFGKKCKTDLSLSENPLGCSKSVVTVLNKLKQPDIFDYPDSNALSLRTAIAAHFAISQETIFFSNGSEGIITALPKLFIANSLDEVIIPAVTFPMFEIASRLTGARVTSVALTKSFDIDLDSIMKKVNKRTKIVFICNPNNPTGRALSKKSILSFASKINAIVVVDEANIDFGGESVIEETNMFSNLIVLRTFSKAYGLAGLRIGFCVANKVIIKELERQTQPFPISSASQLAAVAAVEDQNFINRTRRFMARERIFLMNELSKRGFFVVPSNANNLLVNIGNIEPDVDLFLKKLQEKEISLVSGKAFPGLKGSFVRISPRKRSVNRALLSALDQLYNEHVSPLQEG